MTLKVIPLLQAFSSAIRRTFVQYLTRFQLTARRAVPQRQLGFLCIYGTDGQSTSSNKYWVIQRENRSTWTDCDKNQKNKLIRWNFNSLVSLRAYRKLTLGTDLIKTSGLAYTCCEVKINYLIFSRLWVVTVILSGIVGRMMVCIIKQRLSCRSIMC